MYAPHPGEIATLQRRIDVLEAELQRAREIISEKCDHEDMLKRRIRDLTCEGLRWKCGAW